MIIGFKDQFVEKILNGSKFSTIRRDKTDRYQPGVVLQMVTGHRTPSQKKFAVAVIRTIHLIRINPVEKQISVFLGPSLGWRYFAPSLLPQICREDGFDDQDQFFAFFLNHYGPGLFDGKMIHWDPAAVTPF